MEDIDFNIQILIVDNSYSMRRIINRFFEKKGFHHMLEAGNGIEALEMIQTGNAVQLIVSDLNMPRMNGFELLKIVKKDSRIKDIPFVILTVEAIQTTMIKALDMGADSYIVKPVSEKMFMDEIFRVLRGRKKTTAD